MFRPGRTRLKTPAPKQHHSPDARHNRGLSCRAVVPKSRSSSSGGPALSPKRARSRFRGWRPAGRLKPHQAQIRRHKFAKGRTFSQPRAAPSNHPWNYRTPSPRNTVIGWPCLLGGHSCVERKPSFQNAVLAYDPVFKVGDNLHAWRRPPALYVRFLVRSTLQRGTAPLKNAPRPPPPFRDETWRSRTGSHMAGHQQESLMIQAILPSRLSYRLV